MTYHWGTRTGKLSGGDGTILAASSEFLNEIARLNRCDHIVDVSMIESIERHRTHHGLPFGTFDDTCLRTSNSALQVLNRLACALAKGAVDTEESLWWARAEGNLDEHDSRASITEFDIDHGALLKDFTPNNQP